MVHKIGPHRPAEALLVRRAVDADNSDVSPPRLVIRIFVLREKYPVQNVDRVDVARMNAEQDDALIQPVGEWYEPLSRPVSKKSFARRKKVFLGREDGAVVFQPRIRPPHESFEDEFTVLLYRRVQLAELLNDRCEEIELALRQLKNLQWDLRCWSRPKQIIR